MRIIWLTLSLAVVVGAIVAARTSRNPMARIGLGFLGVAAALWFLLILL
jgi:hypothetical protein